MEIIGQCGCGQVPAKLTLVKIGDFQYNAYGDCCGKWGLLFDSAASYKDLLMIEAIMAWNKDSKETK